MNFELQQAVSLLRNLLSLSGTITSAVDQKNLDKMVDELAPAALQDVERLTVDWVREKEALAERVIAAQEQAALDVIAAEEKEKNDAVQEEVDQAEREERQRAGVS